MTSSTTPQARNAAGLRWAEDGRLATFAAEKPGFGVVDADGRWLSRDGKAPSVWATKKIAAIHAEYPSPTFAWVKAVD